LDLVLVLLLNLLDLLLTFLLDFVDDNFAQTAPL